MTTAAIAFDNVDYRYVSDGAAVGPVSLAVDAGEFAHVMGASGCGKSTLARCAAGLIPHRYRGKMGGEVRVLGAPTTEWDAAELTAAVGLVLQNPAHQMLTSTVENEIVLGLECLALPRKAIAARLEEALQQFCLHGLRSRATHQLSGGEQQRVALAAIAARQPRVLVLDEPLSMLCPTAATRLVECLRDAADRGAAVLAFDHRVGYFEDVKACRGIRLPHAHADAGTLSPPPLPPAPPGIAVECRGLSAELAGRRVLDDVNFRVQPGETVGVVGANGAGKTTLLRCLAGLMPFDGEVATSNRAQPDLYWVAQNPDCQIFNATIEDELRSVGGEEELLDWVVGAFGLAACRRRPSLLLSEGQKKRLVLAVSLLRNPAHGLLLDEPSLGQAPADKATLARAIEWWTRSGKLAIVATHDLEYVADHIPRTILLADGRVWADGPTRQVLGDADALAAAGIVAPAFLRRRWEAGDD